MKPLKLNPVVLANELSSNLLLTFSIIVFPYGDRLSPHSIYNGKRKYFKKRLVIDFVIDYDSYC